jgi:Holliday junction DNA helicase RuvB
VLDIHCSAARLNSSPLDPVLFDGPPGCGKTTLAKIVASRLEVPYAAVSMTDFRPDTFQYLVRKHDGVLLLDEIHAATKRQQDSLLTLLEEGYFQHRGVPVESNPNLTIIGATTEAGSLRKPLIERFRIRPGWEEYTHDDMVHICMGMQNSAGLPWDWDFADFVVPAAVGIPRRLTGMVKLKLDLFVTDRPHDGPNILRLLKMERDGLGQNELSYLRFLDANLIAGLEIIRDHLQVSKEEALEIERLLIKKGFVRRASTGRTITPAGTKRLKQGASE